MTTFTSVDQYMRSLPREVQEVLQKTRTTILKAAPKADEVISYGIPCLKVDGKYLIYFAGYKRHISIYPRTAGMEKQFKKEIAPYKSGKGTLQFSLSDPIPYDLIKKIVEFRLKEHYAEAPR